MAHLLIGLMLVGVGAWGMITWWDTFGMVMRGVIPFFLLVVGLIAMVAGYRRGGQSVEVPLPSPQPDRYGETIPSPVPGMDFGVEPVPEQEESVLKAS